jgi:hypothetical protein
VKPDSLTTAGVALRTAYMMALETLTEGQKDEPERYDAMKQTLVDASKRETDPEEDFVRPKRRAGTK